MILSSVMLTEDEMSILESYVSKGGNLIASRPLPQLAKVFGFKPIEGFYSLAKDCYIMINYREPIMKGFPAKSLQFMGLQT